MGRRRTALWAALTIGVVLAVFVGVLATRQSAASRLADSPLLGKEAPPVSGTTLAGTRLDLDQLRGKWVVLNFFASWCVPCAQEHPELVKLADRGDAQVVAVIWDDTVGRVRKWFADKGGDWPVLDDPGGQVALDFGVRGPPESYVIAPNGAVVAKFVGPLTADAVERVVRGERRT